MGATTASNKERKLELVKGGHIHCGRCPYHANENTGKRPRSTRYKNKKRQTIRDN